MSSRIEFQVDKLDADNYDTWKWQITNVLKAKGLYDIVQISYSNDFTAAQREQESQALALIGSALSNNTRQLVVGCSHAYNVWERLKTVFEHKTSFEKQELLRQLHSFKIDSITDITKSLSKLQTLASKLQGLGEVISDDSLISIIYNALPSSFESLLLPFKLLPQEQRTLESLISNVLARSKELEASNNKEVTALLAGKPYSRDRGRSNSRDRKFRGRENSRERYKGNRDSSRERFRGSRENSRDRDYRGRSNSKDRGRNDNRNRENSRERYDKRTDKSNMACHYCKKLGHFKNECRKLEYVKQKGQGSRSNHEFTFASMGIVGHPLKKDEWVADGGASVHMTPNLDWLEKYEVFAKPVEVTIGNGTKMNAIGFGMIMMTIGILEKVYFVPDLWTNLLSVATMAQNGYVITYLKHVLLITKDDKIVTKGRYENGLGILKLDRIKMQEKALVGGTLQTWHKRLGHISEDKIKRMVRVNAVDGIELTTFDKPDRCESCILGKCHKSSHQTRSTPKATKPGWVLHFDTVGKIAVPSIGGSNYFVLCKDEFSTFRMVACISQKTEAKLFVKQAINRTELETKNKVLCVKTDNGTEFVNQDLKDFLNERGIIHALSAPRTPQQNGYIERDNRTVIESSRTSLVKSKLGPSYWAEAISYTIYTLNRTINSKTGDVTPYELWHGRKPNVSNLRCFGDFAIILDDNRDGKFSPKGTVVRFTGYTDTWNTFRFWNEKLKRFQVSSNVTFISDKRAEETSQSSSENSGLVVDFEHESNNTGDVLDMNNNLEQNMVQDNSYEIVENVTLSHHQRSFDDWINRENRTNSRLAEERATSTSKEGNIVEEHRPINVNFNVGSLNHPRPILVNNPLRMSSTGTRQVRFNQHVSEKDIPETNPRALSATLSNVELEKDPKSYSEAMKLSDRDSWKIAMDEEISSLHENNVWVLVDRPTGKNIVTSRWVFRKKMKTNGQIERYKARLVARGFTQEYGLDYTETYAPVAGMSSLRMLLAYATHRNLAIRGFDVKTAFLYGTLDEEVYMEQPEGYNLDKSKVCLLKRSLYGLKQAPRQWNIKLTNFLKSTGLEASEVDRCIFYRLKPFLVIAIYVDDGIIFAEDKKSIDEVICELKRNFKIHEVSLDSYLGFQISRTSKGMLLHQTNYINKIIKKFNMEDSKAVDSPISTDFDSFCKNKDNLQPLESNIPYREAIGSLMYAAVLTRIDISYAVNLAARSVSNPTVGDWKRVKRIFRYLKGQIDLGIWYDKADNNTPADMNFFCDADFAGDDKTHKSTSGMVGIMANGPIHWRSQRQKIVSLSSTEAELVSICAATQDLIYNQKLAIELKLIGTEPITLHCDNQSAIKLALSENAKQRTRHMNVKAAYPREQIEEKRMVIEHVKAEDQLADMLTKPTSVKQFVTNRNRLMRSSKVTSYAGITATLGLIMSLSVMATDPVRFERTNPIIWVSITDKVVVTETERQTIYWAQLNPCDAMINNKDIVDNSKICTITSEVLSPDGCAYLHAKTLRESCEQLWENEWQKRMKILTLPINSDRKQIVIDDIEINIQNQYSDVMPILKMRKRRGFITSVVSGALGLITGMFTPIKRWIFGDPTEEAIEKMKTDIEKIQRDTERMKEESRAVINTMLSVEKRIVQLEDRIERYNHFFMVAMKIMILIQNMGNKLEELLKMRRMGKLATIEFAELTHQKEFADINPDDTIFHNATFDGTMLQMDISILKVEKNTRVYGHHAFRFWDLRDGQPKLKGYTGTDHIVYNSSSRCLSQVTLPESRWVQRKCSTEYFDHYADQWEVLKTVERFEDIVPQYQHFHTIDWSYIECFPGNITIKGHNMTCPPYVFKLPISVSYITGPLVHDTSVRVINITGGTEAVDRINVGSFSENRFNIEQRNLVKRSIELNQIEENRDENKLMIPKTRNIIYSFGVFSLIIVLGFCYSLYSLYTFASSKVRNWWKDRVQKAVENGEVELHTVRGSGSSKQASAPPVDLVRSKSFHYDRNPHETLSKLYPNLSQRERRNSLSEEPPQYYTAFNNNKTQEQENCETINSPTNTNQFFDNKPHM